MKKIVAPLFLFIMLIINFSCTRHQGIADEIDSIISADPQKPFNGIVMIKQDNKVIYSKAMGYAALESKKQLQLNDQFIIGSISKQVTAVLVLQEYEKGHLELDVPVHQYLPGLKQAWADTITVHHLLTHMHGLQSLDKPTLFKAGTRFDYDHGNNVGYDLLASVIEQTSGKTFAQLTTVLFDQCGMKSSFHPGIRKYGRLVNGYTEQADGALKFDSSSFQAAPAAGCLISTAGDLVLWNENLNNGKLLKPETYKLMTTKKENAIRQHPVWGLTDYGYGITVKDSGNLLQLGQTGFAPGFASMNFYFPQTKTSVIVLENVVYGVDDSKIKFKSHAQVLNAVRQHLMVK